MKAVELFAGAGGLAVGLARAGFDTVFANDIDPYMCQTFQANHQSAVVSSENVATISSGMILEQTGLGVGEVDLVAGGPPCQGFSTVGKKNELDPRNSLPFQYLRLVGELRPRVALFENVSGFKKMYNGRVFDLVTDEFVRLGYELHHRLLNAADFGVPQFRERTIIVAVAPGLSFKWPEATHGEAAGLLGDLVAPWLTLEDALSDLPLVSPGGSARHYASEPANDYQRARRSRAAGPAYHESPRHGVHLLEVIRHVPVGGSILDVPERLRPRGYFSNTYARLWWDRPSTTVTRNFGTPSSSRCIHPLVDRGLTTTEGARLQSFDDDYVFCGPRGSRNLQIGNAVPPLLAEAIGNAIWKTLS